MQSEWVGICVPRRGRDAENASAVLRFQGTIEYVKKISKECKQTLGLCHCRGLTITGVCGWAMFSTAFGNIAYVRGSDYKFGALNCN